MTITEKSSVSEIRRQASHLRDLLSEPTDFQQMEDTRNAIYELRGVIHMKLQHVSERIRELKSSIDMARDGTVTVLLQPEDVPVLQRELEQYRNLNEELIAVLSVYL